MLGLPPRFPSHLTLFYLSKENYLDKTQQNTKIVKEVKIPEVISIQDLSNRMAFID